MIKTNCPFCNPYELAVKSNKTAQLMLADPRKVPGHLLAMPKRHVLKPWNLTNQELLDIFKLIFFAEKRFSSKLGDGFDIRENYRPFVAQNRLKIDHIHFNLLPRSKDDFIKRAEKAETDLYAELDDLEREEVTKLLK